MAATYFTCTLGQAASLNLTNKSFKNINHFIDAQAKATPDQAAVGFAKPSRSDSPWTGSVWTFDHVRDGSLKVAAHLRNEYGDLLRRSKTVALICPSTPDFLFTWLALTRLGHAVLLIAPQCQPAAIVHLCKACEVSLLFHDESYALQSKESAELGRKERVELQAIQLPFSGEHSLAHIIATGNHDIGEVTEAKDTDVAYLHHTSGTSSGVPKPIPQTHRAGAGVLPSFPEGKNCASFTTTPLYHGGVADLFRAWTSGALIWLFPGKDVPITAGNVIKSLNVAENETQKTGIPPVKYFSSVPYVLQMMEADDRGLELLRNLDIVGVGGAALPAEVGDRMVGKGINLISRFGSAECGFLMSSHRDYSKDKEWQYLRSSQGAEYLTFEEQEDGLAELVIRPGWPHMAKKNRDDGAFATADLFAAHESIENAWRYHSRADSQLTLITGKKFDPAPLEGAIATSDLLDDVLIFGNGQPFPGALLFRSEAARDKTDTDLTEHLWPVIDKFNAESQDHARLLRKMLVPMPVLRSPLEKSSKGTVIRGAVEKRFSEAIDNAYTNMSSVNVGDVSDEQVSSVIKDIIESIVPKKDKLKQDTDLFSYGVDSVAGMQIRYGLRQLLPQQSKQLPLNVVEDCGTVARLSEYVIKQRHGQEMAQGEDEVELMLRLVDQYTKFEARVTPTLANGDDTTSLAKSNHHKHDDKDVIVLTGATGALGAHILSLYRNSDSVSKIYCLVRGADAQVSKERVNKALEQRGLGGLVDDDVKIEIVQASLGDENLGLSPEDYERIAKEVSIVMHVAWSVNFRMRLRSFVKDNIAGVTNLINLALRSSRSEPAKFAFCSSVASVMSYGTDPIPEEIIDDPAAASDLGYSRSKWVAEQICSKASQTTPLKGRVAVFRVGQLSGDSRTGIWNTKEAWPMMLSSVKLTKTLPALDNETLDWLPVDIAALALVQGITGASGCGEGVVDVLHVLNQNRRPGWEALLEWLQEEGPPFSIVSPPEWVARLEQAQEKDGADHPAFKLLGHWKKAYGNDEKAKDGEPDVHQTNPFDLTKTKQRIAVLKSINPVDQEYFMKIWRWIDENM